MVVDLISKGRVDESHSECVVSGKGCMDLHRNERRPQRRRGWRGSWQLKLATPGSFLGTGSWEQAPGDVLSGREWE